MYICSMRLLLLLLLNCSCLITAWSQSVPVPYLQWSFDDKDSLRSTSGIQRIDISTYKCPVQLVKSPVGSGLGMSGSSCLVVTNALRAAVTDVVSVELLFKGKNLQFVSFPQQSFRIHLSYKGLSFRTTHFTSNNKTSVDNLSLPLNGSGINSYAYLADGNWHHLVFSINLRTGKKRIWIDGNSPQYFQASIPAGSFLERDRNDGFRNSDAVDELSFYSVELSESQINARLKRLLPNQPVTPNLGHSLALDTMEFAPGYPDYRISTLDQLRTFPLPRYRKDQVLNRNVNWMDIDYLHRVPDQGIVFTRGRSIPAIAATLSAELCNNWNYYLEIPTLRWKADLARAAYNDPATLPGALVQLANQHPEWPVSTILYQIQGNPRHIGDTLNRPYVLAQQLPARYYLRDKNGQFIRNGNQKVLSPLMDLDILDKDARLSASYLNNLIAFLHQPPYLLSENGEIFGHSMRKEWLEMDPAVWADLKKTGLNAHAYSGRFQYRRDASYKSGVVKAIGYEPPAFTFYNSSAIQPLYWPDYAQRRKINQWKNGQIFSTPDFYPRTPDNWSMSRGAFNGFGVIANGRKAEISLGDTDFSPFVSAGWNAEDKNIRPAQWLALLKAMVMLGADHFYAGFFNVTGARGKWPNGIGPYDPRGYIYQAAMPAYAQAIRSQALGFFTEGQLLEPPVAGPAAYRFPTPADNQLVLVRKLGNKMLVYGSIQPNSNRPGNIPNELVIPITIGNQVFHIPIRRQGSTYILDLSDSTPILIPLDSWHQYEHPYYWSRDYTMEASLFTEPVGSVTISTETAQKNNFSDFRTKVVLAPGASVQYRGIVLRKGNYLLETPMLKGDVKPAITLRIGTQQLATDKLIFAQDQELQLEIKNTSNSTFSFERIIFKRID